MEAIEGAKVPFGTKLWLGLVTYVIATDTYALWSEKETLTDALRRALEHPKNRWLVTGSWLITTKHLFFGKYVPWLDPFSLMALSVKLCQKVTRRTNGL